MQGFRVLSRALVGASLLLAGIAEAQSPAMWAQDGESDAIKWSGAKSSVHGLIHSNGGIEISGSRNDFVGGTQFVISFTNHNSSGPNANTFNPIPVQSAPQPFPRTYSIDDFAPNSAQAIAAGTAYIDLTADCEAAGASGVSLSYNNETIPDQLVWAPCDILFDAKRSTGNVTVVSPGKIHFKTHNDSHLSAFSAGILAFSGSTSLKAVHLNGNKSTMHGDFVAPAGEIHIAGSNQTISCGVFANRVKVSGSSLVVGGDECAVPSNVAPMAVDDVASTSEDVPVSIDILANDSDLDGSLDLTSVQITSTPTNGSVDIDPITGVVTYSPALNFVGSDSFQYVVYDDDGDVSQPATVTIDIDNVNDAPLAIDDVAVTDEDTSVQIDVTSNDSDVDGTIDLATVSIVDAPLNGTAVADVVTGVVTYTPDPDFNGQDTLQYTVRDDAGALSEAATVTITVNPVNDAPIASPESVEVPEDGAVAITLDGSDVDGDPLTYAVDSGPASGVLSGTAPELTYTPDTNFSGSDSFTFVVSDGALQSTATVSITVLPVNDAPTIDDQDFSGIEDGVLDLQLIASDVENDALVYTVTTSPLNGVLTGSGPDYQYTPQPNFHGTDSFVVTVSDPDGASATATISITVLPANDQPSANGQVVTTAEDMPIDITLTGDDIDGDILTFIVQGSGPANGSLTGTGATLTYTPNPDFAGSDSFNFVANDGIVDSLPATVEISVVAVNDAPVADPQALTTPEDTSLPITLTGSDPEGDSVTFAVSSGPSFGTLTGTPPNLSYAPNADFFGNDSFEFQADDGAALSVPATVAITVTPVGGDAPTADSQALQTDENLALDIVLTGNDPDGDTISFEIADGPTNGSLTGTPPNIIYLPNAFYEGSDSFTFFTSDGTLQSAVATISIDVIGQGNNPPRITSDAIDKHVLTPGSGEPEVLDLRDWLQYDYVTDGHAASPRWTISADGTVATQWNNAPPSLMLGPSDITNTRIDGIWRVETSSDDDYIGFVFGYQNARQLYLFAWKKNAQGIATRGMKLYKLDNAEEGWDGRMNVIDPDTVLFYENDIPWVSFTDYDFSLSFQPGLFSITVSQAGTVLDTIVVNDASYTNGQFGFYNYSQSRVEYQGFASERLANRVYFYPVAADDPDGDALVYRLLDSPDGMTIDSATGVITWVTDESSVGAYPVTIEVEDPFGATDLQSYELVVTDDAPVFVGRPNTIAFADEQYSDKLTAFDPDPQDPLTYSLLDAPAGLTVNPSTGELQWLPGIFDLGTHAVLAEVVDSQGNRDTLDYVMSVQQRPDNEAPVFISQPPLIATVGRTYQYAPQAVDADGDPIQYGLIGNLPYHMQIFDGANVTWTPTADQVTDWTITVDARDGKGGVAEQTFTVLVQALDNNSPPVITSQPGTSVDIGMNYQYQVVATDADGDLLTYTLENGPQGLTVDPMSGLVEWTPSASDIGFHDIQLRVHDGRGGFADDNFTLAVRDPLVNQAPVITSAPPTQGQVDAQYTYQVAAADPDGDSLAYALLTAPSGMTIGATGLVSWTPNAFQTGSSAVSIEVIDGNGGSAVQSYSVFVPSGPSDPTNNSPTITSTPVFTVEAGLEYLYNVIASDADGDTLGYRILQGPAGMTVDAAGAVRWLTDLPDVGVYTVRVEASDGRGGFAQQGFDLTVFDPNLPPPTNTPPEIVSVPPGLATVDVEYRYDVLATDADGDTLSYALVQAPAGMVVDSSGVVTWTPDAAGDRAIRVRVSDGQSSVEQGWTLRVTGSGLNSPPELNSAPPPTGKVGFEYRYAIQASDADGDVLNYTLLQGPAGMAVAADGNLTWTPAAVGGYPVSVRVDDGIEFVSQTWTLQVIDAAIPLEASISANPPVADLGGPGVQLSIGYSGAAGPVSLSLTVDGVVVPVDASGVTTVPADVVGLHTATAIVSDPYASDSATTTYTVIDPNSTSTPPIVSLTSPDYEEEVTAPRDAIGSVTDPDGDLASWFLALQSNGAAPTEFTTIASGTTEVPNDVLGQIDPTMLLNGLYSVILQATDNAGNVSQDVRVIRVTGDLKIGNFSITFEDFSAPVAGLPVTVFRTYDTRQRNENLDFGYGWSVDYQNVRLQESRDIGFSWALIEEDLGFFSQWCVRPNGDPTVTVRMPDGEVESFVARAEPECTQIVPETFVQIVFEPTDGTDSTLVQNDYGIVRIIGNNIEDLGTPGPIDPDAYTLTTPEGLVFDLDQSFGIRQVEEPNGNTLTFSDAGVVHSQGFSLVFNRDAQGRIESILAPDGTSMTYTYDANGDLEAFTDQVLQTTNFTYKLGVEHYLEDIFDPRGIRVSRNEYDADGRLIAIVDADGNRIEYDHDITGQVETVRDRRGNPTTYIYDDDGNILLETNALGETITRTYDADRNELSMTNDLGHTTSWTYDERGNQLTETNALMQTTTSAYDGRNLLLTVVDPLGNPVMTNVYDPNNTNLLTMTDALNNRTTFHWDVGIGSGCSTGASRGSTDALLQRTTIQPQCVGPFAELPAWQEDTRGVRRSFGYDSVGRQTSVTTTRTDEQGIVQTLLTSLEYDDKGRLAQVTDPENNITINEYNGIDRISASIDANLGRTEFEYDDRGNLVLTRFPDLTTELTGYDEEGNVISRTDRLGRTARMTYDAANRLIETVFPDDTPGDDLDNPRTSSEYDRAGRLVATINERGNRTEFEYDDAGRRTLIRDALLNETRFEYDARSLRTAMVDALGRRTEFVYDDVGRLIETIFPDDTPGDQTDNLRGSISYDVLGRRTVETDLAGFTMTFEYDEIGNMTAVIDSLSQRTEFGYDEQSNKISQTDAELRVTRWAYDDVGRVISRTLPEGQFETFAYDGNGNRLGHVDFNGESHTFGYDGLNRLVSEDFADGVSVNYTYTLNGLAETITDDRGTTSYTYDERDRLTRVSYPNGRFVDYGYDAAGNRTSLTTANQSVSYEFDVLNRLADVTDDAGTTSYDYDAIGNRASIDHANGTRTTYAYDPLDRLTELEQLVSTSTLFDRHTYALDPIGNRLQHAELSGRIVEYNYDDLHRLTAETVTDPNLGNRTANWTYDASGNRLTYTDSGASGATTTTYTYDDNDRLMTETSVGSVPASVTYTYDNNGNTLSKFDGAVTTTYAYSSRNRLISLNSGQATYRYDAMGIRQSMTQAGLTTNYLTDPNRDYAQVIEESFDLNSFAEVRYSYGDDLIQQHRRVDATTTISSSYHYDGIGSTRQLTDAVGAVTDSYTYRAFGDVEASSGSTPNEYRFAGEQYDPNLGFYYLRARYYSPGTGRFRTMDRFPGRNSDPLSLHKYQYAHLNPANRIDPTGLYTADFGHAVEDYVCDEYRSWAASPDTDCGDEQVYDFFGSYLKPDLFDRLHKDFGEVKPTSLGGISSGKIQIAAYEAAFGPWGWDRIWSWAPPPAIVDGTQVYFFNIDGLIFYTDLEAEKIALASVALAALARKYREFHRSRRGIDRGRTALGYSTGVTRVILTGVGAALAIRGLQIMMPVAPALQRI